MTRLLQAAPQEPHERTPACATTCAECGAPARSGGLFCPTAHNSAWNNRQTVRGRVLTPLAIVARVTREGTRGDRATGLQASHEARTLIQRWIDEDRAAGRMAWPEYQRRRYRAGFDPL